MKIGKPRNGKPAYAVMERFDIPSFDEPEVNYLTRWRIVETPWLSLYLHRMDRPDSRPTLHDHPWSFVSLVLRGGYDEMRLNNHTRQVVRRSVRRLNVMRRDDAHYIERLHADRTWTLLLVGRRRRTWGYLEKVPEPSWGRGDGVGEWRWTEFDKHPHAVEFDAAMAARKAQS